MGILTESYLKLPDLADEPEQADPIDQIWGSFRCQMELPEERYAETKAALKELVDLRNELVHHFLKRFDLWASMAVWPPRYTLMILTKPSTATT